MHQTKPFLVLADAGPHAFRFNDYEDIINFHEQLGNLDVATAMRYAGLPEKTSRVLAKCNVRRSSAIEWNIVLQLNHSRTVQERLHLVGEFVVGPEDGEQEAFLPA